MTEEEKTLIAYRMKRARDAIEEAKMLFDAGHFNAYVNRLYYACFYAVSALLLTRDLSTSKHGYLRSLMHREFVKTGLIPKELGKHFDLLFDSRLEGDYGDFAGAAEKIHLAGVNIIGGCCGTGPAHIEAVAANLKK